jgi:hypothetical protein
MRSFFISAILLFLSFASIAQSKDTCCKVEIYLLNGTYTFRPDNFSPIGYYMPLRSYLADTPLVHDDEIEGYEVPRDLTQPYYINLKIATAKRLDSIAKKAPPFDGLPIAIVVDGTPVFGAYIWNVNSQFGCDWIMAMPFPGRLVLYPGMPHYCFTPDHPDPRANELLMDRMQRTYRVVNH